MQYPSLVLLALCLSVASAFSASDAVVPEVTPVNDFLVQSYTKAQQFVQSRGNYTQCIGLAYSTEDDVTVSINRRF